MSHCADMAIRNYPRCGFDVIGNRALRRAGRAAAAEFFHAPPPPKFLATAGANRRRV